MVLDALKETSKQLADLQDFCNVEVLCSVISVFNQTNVVSIGEIKCQLG